MGMKAVLAWATVGFGLAAAALWLASSLVKTPKGRLSVTAIDLGGLSIGSSREGTELLAAVQKQSRLSAWGAGAAAASALAQVASAFFFGS